MTDPLTLAAKTLGTFLAISVLWSFWTAESVSAWLSLWTGLGNGFSTNAAIAGMVLLAVVALPAIAGPMITRPNKPMEKQEAWRASVMTLALLLAMAAMGIDAVYSQLGAKVATAMQSLRSGRLSRLDNAVGLFGYSSREQPVIYIATATGVLSAVVG